MSQQDTPSAPQPSVLREGGLCMGGGVILLQQDVFGCADRCDWPLVWLVTGPGLVQRLSAAGWKDWIPARLTECLGESSVVLAQ